MTHSDFFATMAVATTALMGLGGAILLGLRFATARQLAAFTKGGARFTKGILFASIVFGFLALVDSLTVLLVQPTNMESWMAWQAWALFVAQSATFLTSMIALLATDKG